MGSRVDAGQLTLMAAFQCAWDEVERRERIAITDGNRTLTYPELAASVAKFSGQFLNAGVGHGDRVAIGLERSIDTIIAILGTMAAGACACPMEPKLSNDELSRRFTMANLTWLVADTSAPLPERTDNVPVRIIVPSSLQEGGGQLSPAIAPDDPAFLLFTSGSSGKPKGVLQSHRGLLANALGIIAHSGLSAQDKLLHVMPLYHTNGVNNQILAPLLAGSTIALATRFRADDMPTLLARHRPTIVTGVPTMYSRMLPIAFTKESLESLRMARCGSAPITEELHRKVEEHLGCPLVVSYGLSEATCTSTMNPPMGRRIGSVGTVLQGQSVTLRTPDDAEVTTSGTEGEICITGPALMLGYLEEGNNGVATSPGGVIRTGDLGRFDDDGFLYVTGRIKDVIIRGGENLSPHLIECALAEVPGVANCCVVGKPDADLGEVPLAFVVRTSDTNGQALQEGLLVSAVENKLSRIYKPAQIVFLEKLPENSVGKLDRKALRAMAI
ncbi:class I adenylate-forming enzyme family protein [Cupriavidus sp. 2SB]|uniref:class I adenylate-forming enzyme family protein n=1 Tax=Cupriavidus sp. 2SB TaxID=2502199 RepID=UPI0010F4EA31|nr:class I adenylate-forming enzyme family protein [Cupriavidus sp. 2SB]